MIEKIKSALSYILGLAALVFGALFFAQRRKTETVQSELANEKANSVVKESDHDRQIAKQEADDRVSSYERLKHDYDIASHGAGGDSDL